MSIFLIVVVVLTFVAVILLLNRRFLEWACHAHIPPPFARVGMFISASLIIISLLNDIRGAIVEWTELNLSIPVLDNLLRFQWFGVATWMASLILVIPAVFEVVRTTDPESNSSEVKEVSLYLNFWVAVSAFIMSIMIALLQMAFQNKADAMVVFWYITFNLVVFLEAGFHVEQWNIALKRLGVAKLERKRKSRSVNLALAIIASQTPVTKASLILLLIPRTANRARHLIERITGTSLGSVSIEPPTVEALASRMQYADDPIQALGFSCLISSGILMLLLWQPAQSPFLSSSGSMYPFNETIGLLYTIGIAFLVACLGARRPHRVVTMLAIVSIIVIFLLLPGIAPFLFFSKPSFSPNIISSLAFLSGSVWYVSGFFSIWFVSLTYVSWTSMMDAWMTDHTVLFKQVIAVGSEIFSYSVQALLLPWAAYLFVLRAEELQMHIPILQLVFILWGIMSVGMIVHDRRYKNDQKLALMDSGYGITVLSPRLHYPLLSVFYSLELLAIILIIRRM